jgi:hypothetical protein
MSVNMSGFDKNPFKVGDKVRVKANVLNTFPVVFKNFLSVKYAIVTGIESYRVFTNVDDEPTHFEHFELYKEANEDVMNKQTQQKTKRIHFTHKLWEKWKDVAKIIYIPSGGEVLGFACFPEADSRFCYAYLTRSGTAPAFGSGESFWLEIPVTAKRIPFNPELKDAKVFYGDTELIEWVQMNSGVVCGSYDTGGIDGVITNLYRPNDLQMEIEE